MKVGPDLIESSTVVPTVAGAGVALTVTDTVKNQGSGAAGASTTSFYLSTNVSFDGSRRVPREPQRSATRRGCHQRRVDAARDSGRNGAGHVFVLVRADADNDVVESAETNNTSYGYDTGRS